MHDFKPYANESDEQEIGNLKIENRLDHISLNGDLDITRDQTGLAVARDLKAVIDGIVKVLEGEKLPEKIACTGSKEGEESVLM